jgi:hypothetical protein
MHRPCKPLTAFFLYILCKKGKYAGFSRQVLRQQLAAEAKQQQRSATQIGCCRCRLRQETGSCGNLHLSLCFNSFPSGKYQHVCVNYR